MIKLDLVLKFKDGNRDNFDFSFKNLKQYTRFIKKITDRFNSKKEYICLGNARECAMYKKEDIECIYGDVVIEDKEL